MTFRRNNFGMLALQAVLCDDTGCFAKSNGHGRNTLGHKKIRPMATIMKRHDTIVTITRRQMRSGLLMIGL